MKRPMTKKQADHELFTRRMRFFIYHRAVLIEDDFL